MAHLGPPQLLDLLRPQLAPLLPNVLLRDDHVLDDERPADAAGVPHAWIPPILGYHFVEHHIP